MSHRLILRWIKVELFGFPPQRNGEIIHEIDLETARLNGEMRKLAEEIKTVKHVRADNRSAMSDLLDETLDVLANRPPR